MKLLKLLSLFPPFGSSGASADPGFGPTLFDVAVADLSDTKAGDWSVAVSDLPGSPSVASISVEPL